MYIQNYNKEITTIENQSNLNNKIFRNKIYILYIFICLHFVLQFPINIIINPILRLQAMNHLQINFRILLIYNYVL